MIICCIFEKKFQLLLIIVKTHLSAVAACKSGGWELEKDGQPPPDSLGAEVVDCGSLDLCSVL